MVECKAQTKLQAKSVLIYYKSLYILFESKALGGENA